MIKIKYYIFCIFISNMAFCSDIKYYSQFGQDKYVIEKIFKGKKNGIFMDIGAADGINDSNSYALEKEFGWNGICIEPIIEKFEILKKNRNCILINGCIFNQEAEVDFSVVTFYDRNDTGLSGIINTYDQRHLKLIEDQFKNRKGNQKTIKVKTFKFNDICEKYNFNHIDFLSIDTEGSEKLILQSIDFAKIRIDVITIENNYKDSEIKKILEDKGYTCIALLGVDELYVKKDFKY